MVMVAALPTKLSSNRWIPWRFLMVLLPFIVVALAIYQSVVKVPQNVEISSIFDVAFDLPQKEPETTKKSKEKVTVTDLSPPGKEPDIQKTNTAEHVKVSKPLPSPTGTKKEEVGNTSESESESENVAFTHGGAEVTKTHDTQIVVYCPAPNKTVDATFPKGMPQNLTVGRFRDETGAPFITQDIWMDLVDNRRTFFVRPTEKGLPSMKVLRDWIRSRPHPITLVMNNQLARCWPDNLENKEYELILNEPNLHAVYAGNARKFDKYPKLKPLPVSLHWQSRTTQLFGEKKQWLVDLYSRVSNSAEETKKLFANENRTSTVWVRPMAATNTAKVTQKYLRTNPALNMVRDQICSVLKKTSPEACVCSTEKLAQAEYFDELRKHRFVASPAGNGLDTHSTWEALLAGCIPIVPRSPLDPLFENLPVWLIDSWEEVTDEAVARVAQEFKEKEFNLEKLFASGWRMEIYKGLCTISPGETL
jgi:hypothetical protein